MGGESRRFLKGLERDRDISDPGATVRCLSEPGSLSPFIKDRCPTIVLKVCPWLHLFLSKKVRKKLSFTDNITQLGTNTCIELRNMYTVEVHAQRYLTDGAYKKIKFRDHLLKTETPW